MTDQNQNQNQNVNQNQRLELNEVGKLKIGSITYQSVTTLSEGLGLTPFDLRTVLKRHEIPLLKMGGDFYVKEEDVEILYKLEAKEQSRKTAQRKERDFNRRAKERKEVFISRRLAELDPAIYKQLATEFESDSGYQTGGSRKPMYRPVRPLIDSGEGGQ